MSELARALWVELDIVKISDIYVDDMMPDQPDLRFDSDPSIFKLIII